MAKPSVTHEEIMVADAASLEFDEDLVAKRIARHRPALQLQYFGTADTRLDHSPHELHSCHLSTSRTCHNLSAFSRSNAVSWPGCGAIPASGATFSKSHTGAAASNIPAPTAISRRCPRCHVSRCAEASWSACTRALAIPAWRNATIHQSVGAVANVSCSSALSASI